MKILKIFIFLLGVVEMKRHFVDDFESEEVLKDELDGILDDSDEFGKERGLRLSKKKISKKIQKMKR